MSEQTQIGEPHHPRPQWRSQVGFILAALGSAVGLGNIWRFSYLCYKNGGGAFLVPYVIALLVVGIPLMILELGIGHKMRGSAPMTFAKVNRNWEWCGWWAVISAMFGIMLYYSVIISWCVNYVFFSFNQAWGTNADQFFYEQFLQKSSGPTVFGDIVSPIVFALIAVWGLSWLIVFFGVQKGVERANKVFMPLLFVLIIVLVGISLSLEGAGKGIAVYLTPKFDQLSKKEVWIDAFSQIFFTLSLSFGIMITYASYLPRKVNIVRDAYIISIGNCLFSFIAGFAVFGTLGYMSHSTGKPVEEVVSQAIGLAFVTYPQAISFMPSSLANIFGIVFFVSLVVAGLSSAVSLIEAFGSAIIDKFHYSRKSVVSVICIIGFLGSIVFTAQSGLYWIDIVDHFINQYGLVVIGILQCVLLGWIFKLPRLREHINSAGNLILSKFWDICIRFITPAVLIVLFINNLQQELSKPYGGYPWEAIILIGRDWLMVALIAALFVAMRPWKRSLDEDDAAETI